MLHGLHRSYKFHTHFTMLNTWVSSNDRFYTKQYKIINRLTLVPLKKVLVYKKEQTEKHSCLSLQRIAYKASDFLLITKNTARVFTNVSISLSLHYVM